MHPVLSIGLYGVFLVLVLVGTLRMLFRGSARTGKRRTVILLLTALALVPGVLPVLGAMLPDCAFKFFAQAAGNLWLGFLIYYSMVLIVLSLIALPVFAAVHRRITGACRMFPLISLIAGLIIFVFGLYHAQQPVRTEYDVTIEKSAGGISDLKIVLIADLHMSVNSTPRMIERMVEKVNAEDPDAVLIAGDIFTSSYKGLRNPERYAEILRGMKSKYGVFAVYGNHDVEETLFGGFPISPISQAFRTSEMESFFSLCGFRVLYDEIAEIADGAVLVAGRVDGEKAGDGTALRKSAAELPEGSDLTKPVIVLQHEPVEFAALKEAGADLALCGHTHAGQIFPGNLIVPFFNENAYGCKNVGGLDTIVTAGVGYYGPPMRVGTDSEVTVVHIHFT